MYTVEDKALHCSHTGRHRTFIREQRPGEDEVDKRRTNDHTYSKAKTKDMIENVVYLVPN